MKKLFSHPLFYACFTLLGVMAMALQFWFCSIPTDEAGLLPVWHVSTTLTITVVLLGAVLALMSTPHIRIPQHPALVRAVGAALAAVLTVISAVVLLGRKDVLTGVLALLAGLGSVYVALCRLKKWQVHYSVYALFALCFMFYLISCYRGWSAEPETVRYLFPLLALVCAMLVFYQKAAFSARIGNFSSYHFWRCTTLVLSLAAIPTSKTPLLYLTAALWMALDSAQPQKKSASQPKEEA
jgi:hypothetical protein